jgi:hypothetical protein
VAKASDLHSDYRRFESYRVYRDSKSGAPLARLWRAANPPRFRIRLSLTTWPRGGMGYTAASKTCRLEHESSNLSGATERLGVLNRAFCLVAFLTSLRSLSPIGRGIRFKPGIVSVRIRQGLQMHRARKVATLSRGWVNYKNCDEVKALQFSLYT